MSLIKTNSELPEKVKKELIAKGAEDLKIGDLFIRADHSADILRIREISYYHKELTVYYDHATDCEGTTWSSYGSDSIEGWNRKGYQKLTKSLSEHLEEAKKVINGEISMSVFEAPEGDEMSAETALIAKSSKDSLIAMQNDMESKKKKVELITAFVGYEMERKKQELQNIRSKLQGIMKVWEKKIRKIMKVITTIELYLGVDEELFQIQEGENAPQTTPISFRQLVLFMDEEVANTDNGGLDFDDVKKFDEWLLENNNYKKLLPEEKGVVVFRPRRKDKNYGKDDRDAYAKNVENRVNTYLLIRNGDNLYRIYTDKIAILDRLFPRKKELEELLKETAELQDENQADWRKEEAQDKVDDMFYSYRKRAILMQGLIDRTNIFHPLPIEGLSMFNLEGSEDYIKFIYDDEASLTDGRLPFKQWLKEINQKINNGSRIVLNPDWKTWGESSNNMVEDRGFKYYNNKYSIPAGPTTGLYEVEKYQERETKFFFNRDSEDTKNEIAEGNWKFLERRNSNCDKYFKMNEEIHSVIKYNPGGEIYSGWGHDSHERKNRIAFRIFNNDSFIMNYDQISLEDIEYYIHNRADRPNYLEMLPLLRTLKKWRLAELENEKFFAKLVLGELMKLFPKFSQSILEADIDSLIEWWKFKNMIKRPIDKDDAKALRMIIKEFTRKNK